MRELTVQSYQNQFPQKVINWCNETAPNMAEPSFFCSGDWLASAARFEADTDIITLTEAQNDDLVAVLPLTKSRNRLGGIDAHVIGARFHPDPLGLICSKNNLAEASSHIRRYFETKVKWDSLTIDWTTASELEAWGEKGESQTVAPYLSIGNGFEAVLGQFRKKKRYNLKSSVKVLLQDKGAFVVECETPKDKLDCFGEFFKLHRKRAQQRGIKSSVEGREFYEHHSTLLQNSANTRLFALKLEGRILAVIYGFEYAGRFSYYQVAHDPEFGDLSPGKVILFQVIKHYSDNGFTEFNFLQGDEEYKALWTSDKRALFRLRLEHRNLRTMAYRCRARAKRKLKILRDRVRNGH